MNRLTAITRATAAADVHALPLGPDRIYNATAVGTAARRA
jgi:hypothetical protein